MRAGAGVSYAAYRYATIGDVINHEDALSERSTRIEAQQGQEKLGYKKHEIYDIIIEAIYNMYKCIIHVLYL